MNSERTAIVLDFEDRRFAAMETNDVAALEAVLADDLHYTHANGMVEDKAEVIRRIASGERVIGQCASSIERCQSSRVS